jgi:hypothetical protein
MQAIEAKRRSEVAFTTGTNTPRPTQVNAQVESAAHPIVVHYGPNTDVTRANLALSFFDAAWDQQVTGVGFDPPPADGTAGGDARYDVYLVGLPPQTGAVTFAEADVDPNDGRHASSSFIEIDPSLPDDLLEVYSHHEFQHALQFAIDTLEPVMWYESNAVYWEIRTRPDVTDWQSGLPDFQSNPQFPVFADSLTVAPFATGVETYEYGAVLFALYLDEVHGDGQGTVLHQIWEGCPEPDSTSIDEPDFIDAANAIGIDIKSLIPDFVGWRALVGPLAQSGDGPHETVAAIGRLVPLTLSAATLDGTLTTTDDASSPFALGCAVREVTAPADVDEMPVTIAAAPTLGGQAIAVSTLVYDESAGTVTRTPGTSSTAQIETSVSVPKNALLQVAFCDVTDVEPDDPISPRPVTISIKRTDVSFPDAGTPSSNDAGPGDVVDAGTRPPPSCTCDDSSPSRSPPLASIGALGFVLSLFTLGVRAFRARRRKSLFARPRRDEDAG